MIGELAEHSIYFGVLLSLVAYGVGLWLKRLTGWSLVNPLFIAIVLVISTLLLFDINYDTYSRGADIINYLLTPSTICLALPLYQQLELLKLNYKAVMAGIISGALSSVCIVLLLAVLLGFDHASYVTFLPKSITTAIGIGVSKELGGYVSISVAVIILTGVFGGIVCEKIFKWLHIDEPIARGVALGTASHAIGTSKAMEFGVVEGSMSSLSIVVCGIITVILAPISSHFL